MKNKTGIRDFIVYCVFGALATALNTLCYYFLFSIVGVNNVLSTALAWIITFIFTFFTNKIIVYRKKGWKLKEVLSELFSFFLCRGLTGILDVLFMYITVSIYSLPPILMKLISSLIVGIINFLVGEYIIFRKDKKTK